MKQIRHSVVIGLLVTSLLGCTKVSAYGDSILTEDNSGFPPPAGQQWSGQIIRQAIDAATRTDTAHENWHPAPGTEMAGVNAHPQAGGLYADGTTKVVLSFGTNDANYYSWGADNSHDSNAAKFYALQWLINARSHGANCVVWVLGAETYYGDVNSYAAPGGIAGASITGPTAAARYHDYMVNFNGFLRSLGGSPTLPDGSTIILHTADWGAVVAGDVAGRTMPDRVHPSASGAQILGDLINQVMC